MLTIHPVTSASDAKKYYSVSDYYREGQSQETVGRWGGKLAATLGLSGTVDKASFDALCDNLHPKTGERLTQRTNDNRRVAYDLTFSGPKAFSILEALASEADRKALLAAFDESVTETMDEAEADMQTRVRLDGESVDRPTGNLVHASYDHSTARPANDNAVPDMQRHRHVVAFNATLDPVEGRIKAGQFSYIKRDGEYFAAAFYSRLASKVEALGYAVERRGGKEWGIAGISRELEAKFSKRTDQVEEEARRLGITDAGRKAELGAKTRSKKQKELTPDQLRKAWRDQLSDAERAALARVYRKEIEPDRSVTAAEAVRFAIDHVSEKLSVAPEREFKRVALLHGLGCVTADQIDAETPRQGIIAAEYDGRRMATTAALQAEEDFIAAIAAGGRGEVEPVGVVAGLSRTLADGKRLNDGQWQAVSGLLQSPNRVNLVEGPAGAGKSSLLAKLDEGMKLAGERITYLATTAAAAEVLQKDGFDAKTVAHFLLDTRLHEQSAGGRVVIDESSMLPHRDAVRLYTLARERDLKLIHVGDPMQHGSVPRGSFLHVLKSYGHVKPFRLTTILRQELPEYRHAAELLSEGKSADGLAALDSLGWVKEVGDDTRYRQMAAEYVAAWQELERVKENDRVLVVSPTHAEAARITAEIRSQLRNAGLLGSEEIQVTRLVPVDASEAERRLATTYMPGDVIQFHQNAAGGHTKGDRLTVADPAAVPLEHAAKFSLYRPERLSLAVGDRVRFTGTVKTLDGKHTLKNGNAHRVAGFTASGIRLDNGWLVSKDAGHLRAGFVETSFGSQGRTTRRVILGMSSASLPATNAEQLYVSATRAKERLSLYTDDKAAVAAAIARSSRKLAAIDLKPPPPVALASEPVRQRMAKRRKLAFIERLRSAWSGIRKQPTPPLPGFHAERLTQSDRGHGYGR